MRRRSAAPLAPTLLALALLAPLLAPILAPVLASAPARAAEAAPPLPERVRAAGRLVIGTYPNYPPLTFRDPATNQRQGFDIDLGEALGRELGLRVEWQEMPFVQFIPSLQTGRIDLALDGISDLPARRDTLDFVDYLRTGAQFYTLDATREIAAATDLCGKRVGASRSTNWPRDIAEWSRSNCEARGRPAITVVGTEGSVDARTQLRTGRIDAGVQGNETLGWLNQTEPGVYRVLGEAFTENLAGVPVSKEEPMLRDAVRAALTRLHASGAYAQMLRKWKLEQNAVPAITLNEGRG